LCFPVSEIAQLLRPADIIPELVHICNPPFDISGVVMICQLQGLVKLSGSDDLCSFLADVNWQIHMLRV
ncbi:MAG: hypothetical protein HRU12_19990, partial [Phaeodactylibacter sp.]|nr:hypothetical protein [Phaeodactylibacter sp.]